MSSNKPKIEHFTVNEGLQYALLDLEEFALFHQLSDKRAVEKNAAFYVVRSVLKDEKIEIFYEESGKPFLKNGFKISISHSYNKLAVLFSSTNEAGIDIEKVRDKILKIKTKFLSPKELEDLKDATPETYTLYWGAKEALYKATCITGLLFAEQLRIEPFIFSDKGGEIKALVKLADSEKKHTLHYQVLNEYILVYTVT